MVNIVKWLLLLAIDYCLELCRMQLYLWINCMVWSTFAIWTNSRLLICGAATLQGKKCQSSDNAVDYACMTVAIPLRFFSFFVCWTLILDHRLDVVSSMSLYLRVASLLLLRSLFFFQFRSLRSDQTSSVVNQTSNLDIEATYFSKWSTSSNALSFLSRLPS